MGGEAEVELVTGKLCKLAERVSSRIERFAFFFSQGLVNRAVCANFHLNAEPGKYNALCFPVNKTRCTST